MCMCSTKVGKYNLDVGLCCPVVRLVCHPQRIVLAHFMYVLSLPSPLHTKMGRSGETLVSFYLPSLKLNYYCVYQY